MTTPTRIPASVLAPFAIVSAPALRTTDARFWDKPSIRDFDVGDTNQAVALQAAITAGATYKKAAYIPAGDYTMNSGVIMTSVFGVEGDGDGRSTLTTVDLNGPLFSIQTIGSSIENSFISDINARAYYTADGVDGSNAAFLEYANGTPDYIQHNRFQNIGIEGFATGFRNSATTRTTAFGQESYVNWTRYEDIRLTTFSRAVKVGFDFKFGSGTGNTFTGIDSNVGGRDPDGVSRPGTLIRMGGTGCVVGDVIVTNSHLGGYAGSALFEGSAGTLYRQRISFNGMQFDAGMDNVLSLDTTGGEWSNIVLNGNNIGGNAKIANYIPPLRSSIVDDQGVGCWRSGNYKSGLPGGSQTISMFDLYIADNDGVFVEIVGSGLVQGVSPSSTLWSGLVQRGAGTATVVVRDGNVQNPASASAITIGVTATSYGIHVTTNFTASGSGSAVDCQIQVRGGKHRVVRL